MNIETFRDHCLQKPGVTESFPFGPETLVFKVMNKMFALTQIDQFDQINLKADPEESILLQETYEAVRPGYHMNKRHWITVDMDGSLLDSKVLQWVDKSYELVVRGLNKRDKTALERM